VKVVEEYIYTLLLKIAATHTQLTSEGNITVIQKSNYHNNRCNEKSQYDDYLITTTGE